MAATIVCQRTNGLWNGTMRERYAVCIQALVVTLIIALLAVTLGVGVTARTVFAAVGLALPLFRWVFKEMTQQKEAGAASQKVVGASREALAATPGWRGTGEASDRAGDPRASERHLRSAAPGSPGLQLGVLMVA